MATMTIAPTVTPAADTRVRMILYDYDAAPDGCGTYTKLNQEFSSARAALDYRSRYLHDMYWGRIEMLDGQVIKQLDEIREDDDYCDLD